MRADELSDEDFFSTLASSGARALLIGRRALILLGAPVMTADFDLWIHIDDIEKLNDAFYVHGVVPNRSPDQARASGRYVLENGERIDVMVARGKSSEAGELRFEDAWIRRQSIAISPTVSASLPSLPDLLTTKRWASRPKDLIDIQFIESLMASKS